MWCPLAMPALPPYEMLFRGHVAPDAIGVEYVPGGPPRSAELADAVAREWSERVERAAREGIRLTNGALLRLARYGAGDGRLRLVLGDTTYADFLATNGEPERRVRMPWEELANPLGTSALVLTRDGSCLLGLRGGGVLLHRGHVHTIGGMFEAADLVEGRVDAPGSILREVREELAVGGADVLEVVCRGIMRDLENLQPELMFEVRVALTADEVEARWSGAESRDEHEGLVRIGDEPSAIREYLGSGVPMAPQAAAALELRAGG